MSEETKIVEAVESSMAAVSISKEEEVELSEEVLATPHAGTSDDAKFDAIVGAIETIMMDESFRGPQEAFCRENCSVFEDSKENKLEYTTLFERYTELTETLLMQKLDEAVEDFSMPAFLTMLTERKDQIAGDVFDLLTSFGDFEEFKGVMLSYKAQVAFESGNVSENLVFAPIVTSVPATVEKK